MKLFPTNAVVQLPMQLFRGDTVTINQGDGNVVNLIKAEFDPALTTDLADLVIADFDGYAEKTSNITPNYGLDPSSGAQIVEIPAPAGGWRWEVTGLTLLPMTIFGIAVTGQDSGNCFGSGLFEEPIVLNELGDLVQLDSVQFELQAGAMGQ